MLLHDAFHIENRWHHMTHLNWAQSYFHVLIKVTLKLKESVILDKHKTISIYIIPSDIRRPLWAFCQQLTVKNHSSVLCDDYGSFHN